VEGLHSGVYNIRSLISSEVEDARVVWLFRSVIPTGTTCREPEEASEIMGTVRSHCRNSRVGRRKGFKT